MTLSTYWHNLIERGKIHFGPLQVQVDYSYEEEPLESLFPEESAEWYARTAKAVERSDMPYVVAKVTVSLDGVELAHNTLGGLLYDSWEEFERSMTEDDHGVVAETVDDARDQWDKMQALMTQPKVVA